MQTYQRLLAHVLVEGELMDTRAILPSTGRPVRTRSVFGHQAKFDLRQGFPAITVRKLFLRGMVAELLWFIRGETNVRSLQAQDVHIWDEWSRADGDVGPVYGKQWRAWEGPDGLLIDQLMQVVRGIEAVKKDPHASVGRRLIVSAWNPVDLPHMALPPCHAFFQFSVRPDGRLDLHLYQRSADLYLGVPFNIASYALLLAMVAQVTGLVPGVFTHSFGDLHLYENHWLQAEELLRRTPMKPPELWLNPKRTSLEAFVMEDVKFTYQSHPALGGEVAV